MKKFSILFLILIMALSCQPSFCGEITETSGISEEDVFSWSKRIHKDALFQVSSYDAYINGYYNSSETTVSVKNQCGNFGYGILKDNTGAVLFLNDKLIFKVKNFGIFPVKKAEYLPITYGTFKNFNTDDRVSVKNASTLSELTKQLDEKLDSQNYFIAIRAKGAFNSLILQSEADERKVVQNVKGTLIGFKIPTFYGSVSRAGYTFYFISDDKMAAGKVLDLNAQVVSCYLDYTNRAELILPKKKDFKIKDFSQYSPIETKEQMAKKQADKEQTPQKNMQKMINQSNSEPTPEEMMQLFAPKMSF